MTIHSVIVTGAFVIRYYWDKKTMVRFLFTSALLMLAGFSKTSAQVNIQDSMALVTLYDATNGDAWKNNTNWLIGPVSTWYGITLQGDRVYLINLYDNGLEGYIPDEIGQLTALVELDLSLGNFTGGIPNVFWDMADFYQLRLRGCGLTGMIPSSLSSCLQFGRLSLEENQLTGTIPPSLASCSNLIHLLLGENNLSGPFPPVIESFQNLEQLELSGNEFTGTIPDWIESLDDLWWLLLERIPFSGPTPFLGDKPNLEYLYINNNTLTGNFEDIFGAYPNLKYCNIDHTLISGHLSTTHFNPANIRILEVSNNYIESMDNFTSWQNQSVFQRLEVDQNQLNFDDLLTTSGLPGNKFIYAPQKPLGTDTVVILLPGEEYAIYSPMEDEDIVYQWYFNQMLIEGVENYDLILPPFNPQLVGDFYFTATHPSLPNLTLQSGVTTLVEGTTAIDALDKSHLSIYPNPASDYITIKSDQGIQPQTFQLYTAAGQLIRHIHSNVPETIIPMEDCPSGIYLLKWINPEGIGVRTVVKR